MQDLHKPKAYPPEILKLIMSENQTGVQRANIWMLGWPGRVKALIAAGEYQSAFKSQVQKDREADLPEYSHLSSWEKREVMGMTDECPTVG